MTRKRLQQSLLTSFLISLACISSSVAAQKTATPQTLDNLVMSWLNRADIKQSLVGVEIMELPSGRVLFTSNGNRRFVPASTAKVMTTACAFDTFGSSFTYTTSLVFNGTIKGDTMHGDLVIVPSQDPSFTQADLRTLLNTLRQRQIKKIDGSLRIQSTAGGVARFNPGWLAEDWGQEWMPLSSNLVVDRNVAQGVQPLNGMRIVEEPWNQVPNGLDRSLMTSNLACGWVCCDLSAHQIRTYLSPGVTAKSPLVVANPDEYNATLAQSIVSEIGIHIGHQRAPQIDHNDRSIAEPLGEHVSKPLSKLIEITLHESDNLYAQQLLRSLGLPQVPAKPNARAEPASDIALEDRGLNRLRQWMIGIGVPDKEFVLCDGCGLSRKNCVSPHALNTVIKHMAGPKTDGPYIKLLKAGGYSSKSGIYHFKTGAMESVRSMSGMLETVGGQKLAVTVMVNGHTPSIHAVKASINEFIGLLDSISTITIVPAGTKSFTAPEPAKDKNNVVEVTLTQPQRPSTTTRARRHRTKRH